jgi:hypothetical protein
MSHPDFLKGECHHCAGHVEFPAEAIGQTVPCPHCGRPTELAPAAPPNKTKGSRRAWRGIGLAVSLVAAGLAGAFLWRQTANHRSVSASKPTPAAQSNAPAASAAVSTNAPVVSPQPQAQAQTNDFAIMPYKLEKTSGSSLVYVTGIVRNLSDRQRFGVKIEFGLSDSNDIPAGSATDYQSVLEPHAEWRFKAMVMASKAASARFNSIAEDK